jgi:hypothetical protein
MMEKEYILICKYASTHTSGARLFDCLQVWEFNGAVQWSGTGGTGEVLLLLMLDVDETEMIMYHTNKSYVSANLSRYDKHMEVRK